MALVLPSVPGHHVSGLGALALLASVAKQAQTEATRIETSVLASLFIGELHVLVVCGHRYTSVAHISMVVVVVWSSIDATSS